MTQADRPVVDFDHFSKEFAEDWRGITADLRSRCPVAWTEANGGHWVVSGYDEVRTVALDDETYSSDNDVEGVRNGYKGAGTIPGSPMQLIPLEVDPPLFYAYRKLLNPHFSPSASDRWRPFVAQAADAIIDRFCADGSCELVHDLASPVPAILTMRILGLPLSDWEKVATPFHEISWTAPGTERNQRATEGVFGVLQMLVGELADRRDNPRDDMLSFLVTAEMDGRKLTDEEILKICFLLFIGGVDTSTGLLAHALAWLSDHPDEAVRLVDDPAYLRTATEEFLRWSSPAPALCRTVTKETKLGGQTLSPGDRLLLSWASANQDEKVFPNPHDAQLDRWPNRHQAFGLGAHRCLGSNLGRVQFQEVLVTALKRLPDLKVDMSGAELYPTVGQVNGYTTLPATFTPTAPVGAELPE